MKKFLIATLVALMSCMSLFAKSDVELIKGSVLELKNSKATICAVWDYSQSTIEDKEISAYLKEMGPEWQRDYAAEIKRAENAFIKRLQKKSKDVVAVEGTDADYKIVVKVSNFHYGSTGLSVVIGFGAGDAHLDGTVEVYKVGKDQPIAVFNMNGVPGGGWGNEKRREECYRELANHLVKQIKKAK